MTFLAKFHEATGGYHEVQAHWMSPSNMRPLILQDPLLLWLNLGFGAVHGFKRDPDDYSFLSWIGQKGHDFEAAWIANHAPNAFQVMANDYDVRRADGFKKTLMAMDAGIPIMHKAALWSADLQIYGTADLLIRSDEFYSRFPHLKPEEQEPLHYLVADCKFSSALDMPNKRKDLLINATQVRLYSAMVGLLQGYMPKRAYLMTRSSPECPLPIEVNLSLDEPLNDMMRDLLNRFQHIKKNGAKLLPWRDPEVAPNIGNDKTEPWSQAKKQIIAMLPHRPLELLPNIGPAKANAMRASGIAHLDQLLATAAEKINLQALNGIGAKTNAMLQAVLHAHRTGKPAPVPADAIPPQCETEFYIDYETLSNCNVDFGQSWETLDGTPMIFMVGIGRVVNGRWNYHQIVAPEESRKGERILIDRLHEFLAKHGVFDPGRSVKLWHWSSAEPTCSAAAAMRQGPKYSWLAHLPWHDLQKIVKGANLVMPTCFGFGLKEYTAALGKHDSRYAVEWPSGLDVGLNAMVAGWKMYTQPEPRKSPEFALLSAYLEADIKSLWRVLSWIRSHAQPERKAARIPFPSGWYTTALRMQVEPESVKTLPPYSMV